METLNLKNKTKLKKLELGLKLMPPRSCWYNHSHAAKDPNHIVHKICTTEFMYLAVNPWLYQQLLCTTGDHRSVPKVCISDLIVQKWIESVSSLCSLLRLSWNKYTINTMSLPLVENKIRYRFIGMEYKHNEVHIV